MEQACLKRGNTYALVNTIYIERKEQKHIYEFEEMKNDKKLAGVRKEDMEDLVEWKLSTINPKCFERR